MMLFGGALWIGGIALPFVESAILASVMILGLLIAGARKMPLWASSLMVGSFAVFHGHAHGAEMPAENAALLYGVGFALATAFLHAGGIAIGRFFRSHGTALPTRILGACIAAGGVYLSIN
jgi:urease accessory protein